ncbi:MAG: hypothetical protein KBD43_11625 [Saprospiraceae bacterium]|nr:hypothetical protein [Saprospiraceae bacterium]
MKHLTDFQESLLSINLEIRRTFIHDFFLSTCESQVSLVSKEDCLLLLRLLKDTDLDVREHAAAILTNLLSEQRNKIILGEAGAILACIPLLNDRSENILQSTVLALFNALSEYANQWIFMEADGLSTFIPLLRHEETEIKITATKILEVLMRERDFQLILVQKNYLPFLIKLIDDTEDEVITSVILILHQLATNTRTQPYLIDELIFPKIQALSKKTEKRLERAWLIEILDKCDSAWKARLKRKQREALKTSSISIIFSDYIQTVSSLLLLSNEAFVSGDENGIIAIWDTAEGRLLKTLQGHASSISTMILLINEVLVSGTVKGIIQFWNYREGVCLRTVTGNSNSSNIPSIKASTLLSNGQLATSYGNFIHIWDKPCQYYDVTLRVHTSGIRSLAGLPHRQLACGHWGSNDITIFNVKHMKIATSFVGHTKPVTALMVLQQELLISGSEDYSIKFWEISTELCVQTLLGHSSPVEKLEMTPNNQLVSSTISTIKIWDCVTGMCLSTLEPLCFIRAIMVLPGCRLLISTQSGETAQNSFNLISLNAKTNQYQVLPNVDENQKVPALKIFSIFSHRSQEKTKNNSVINSFNLNESLQKFYAVPRPCYRHRFF